MKNAVDHNPVFNDFVENSILFDDQLSQIEVAAGRQLFWNGTPFGVFLKAHAGRFEPFDLFDGNGFGGVALQVFIDRNQIAVCLL